MPEALDQAWEEEPEELQHARSFHERELEGNWTALSGVGPLKGFPICVSIIYLTDWDSVSKIFADKELNPLSSVNKYVATVSQSWTPIGLSSHSSV